MSELVKQWKAIKQKKFYLTLPASTTVAGLDEIASEATEIGDKMADLIEKQDRLLGLYREYRAVMSNKEMEIGKRVSKAIQISDKIKQEETL